jgi:pullulanase/glycogen debranching enzyme
MAAPLGATAAAGGVNFSVFSRHATLVELLLFDARRRAAPTRVLPLHPDRHRTYHYWHAFVPGLGPGQVYAFRAHGPFAPAARAALRRREGPARSLRAGRGRARGIRPRGRRRPGDNAAHAMKSVVADLGRYDWEGDQPLRRPSAETVIYELHVRGFTRHPSSGVAPGKRGTFAGLVEKIPYLVDLGITAVELLPVFQFDPQDAPPGRTNYWGYQPVSFFAPHHAYASRPGALAALDEFRDMVKALHRAGIEVILDVVFNHTTEGGEGGPTLSCRGLANDVYYILEPDKSRYADYTGCGNTLNANQSIVRRLIQDSLRHWVTQMHVDGFRFDLASILSRDQSGQPLPNPPVLWDIESDPLLAGTKLIAEAWDAAGLYQVGSFVGDTWQEWNGRFRDDVRRFLKGDEGAVSAVAARLLGSPDIFAHEQREAEQSVNFVTCHDGFTLNDLVSYGQKHNEANGEDNRDGSNDNLSWNCGAEGPTDDPASRPAQPPGEELPGPASSWRGHADAADGRRGAPHPARQQQRLLPGRGPQLARLDPWRPPRRRPSLRAVPDRLPPAARRPPARTRDDPERAPAAGPDRVARRVPGAPGLERPLARHRLLVPEPRRAVPPARDVQRALGAADVRAAGGGCGGSALAAVSRHHAGLAPRHRDCGRGPDGGRRELSGGDHGRWSCSPGPSRKGPGGGWGRRE